VLRRGESWDGWLAAVWEGRGGMGKKMGKKKEKQRKRGRECRQSHYVLAFTDGITDENLLSVISPVEATRR
jgi:hypothetical protein